MSNRQESVEKEVCFPEKSKVNRSKRGREKGIRRERKGERDLEREREKERERPGERERLETRS